MPASYYRSVQRTIDRFWAKVDKTGECWLWTGAKRPGKWGYGAFWVNPTMVLAHRFSYELLVGPVPNGLVLDHLCREPACVRPDHLQPVLNQTNVQRQGISAANRSGHRGVYWYKRTQKWRVCVKHNGKSHSGGYFDELTEAAAAAIALRERLFQASS